MGQSLVNTRPLTICLAASSSLQPDREVLQGFSGLGVNHLPVERHRWRGSRARSSWTLHVRYPDRPPDCSGKMRVLWT